MDHDFNGHVINGIHGVNGKECYYRGFHLVNKLYDFTGMLDLSGNFCYDDFSVKVMHDCISASKDFGTAIRQRDNFNYGLTQDTVDSITKST